MRKTILKILLALACAALALFAFIYPRLGPAAEAAASPEAALSPSPEPSAESAPETTPPPTPVPTPEYFTISMVGDCTLASTQYNDNFEETLNGDMTWPFSGTSQYFTGDYLTIANLECSFSDEKLSGTGTFQFLAPSSYAQILSLGGVDFVTLANNHTADFGRAGVEGSEAALDAAGVSWAEPDGSYVFKMGDGISVGLYAARWTAGEDEVVAGVSALRERGDVDIVIVLMHWGLEGSYRVTAGQEQLGHAAIDAGADIVYGSHPHVLQRVEEYGGGYIMYSLGNWSFGGNTAPRDRDTAIIQVTVKRGTDGTVSLEGWTAVPCCLSSTPNINDYRPEPYDEGSDGWSRAMSKLDGTWTGPDLTIDYSGYHKSASAPAAAPEDVPAAEG